MAECFGMADFYSSNLKKLGYEAEDAICNGESLQRQWANENGVKTQGDNWLFQVLLAQIKKYQPDVLYVFEGSPLSDDFLWEIKPFVRLMVGQIACSLPQDQKKFRNYDLILSSLPNIVEQFKKMGIPAEFLRLGFEETILKRLKKVKGYAQ